MNELVNRVERTIKLLHLQIAGLEGDLQKKKLKLERLEKTREGLIHISWALLDSLSHEELVSLEAETYCRPVVTPEGKEVRS